MRFDNATASATAPGKWILFGEHFVVEGAPALVWPLEQRTLTVHARSMPGPGGLRVTSAHPSAGSLLLAVRLLGEGLRHLQVRLELHIESTLSMGQGLGSSAALVVAMDEALAALRDDAPTTARALPSPSTMARLARLEEIFHKRSSGLDLACVASVKPLRYVKTPQGACAESLKVDPPPVVLVLSASGHRTRDVQARSPGLDARLLDDYLGVLSAGEAALAARDAHALGAAMDANQRLLEALGVVDDNERELCARVKRLGAQGAKITGAGGGGAVAVLHRDPARLCRALAELGLETIRTTSPPNPLSINGVGRPEKG